MFWKDEDDHLCKKAESEVMIRWFRKLFTSDANQSDFQQIRSFKQIKPDWRVWDVTPFGAVMKVIGAQASGHSTDSIAACRTLLNRVGDRLSPCMTPDSDWMVMSSSSNSKTRYEDVYNALMMSTVFFGNPYFRKMLQRSLRLTLSKALTMSKKSAQVSLLYSFLLKITVLTAQTLSATRLLLVVLLFLL